MVRFFLWALVFSVLAACNQQESQDRGHSSKAKVAPLSETLSRERIAKPLLSSEKLREIEDVCAPYAQSYAKALSKTDASTQEPDDQPQIKSMCSTLMKRRALNLSAGTADLPSAKTYSPNQKFGVLGIIDGLQGETGSGLKLAGSTDELPSVDEVFSSDLAQSILEQGLQPVVGDDLAGSVADVLNFLTHGVGVGFAMSAGAGAGVATTTTLAMEAVYHRPSGAGELGLYCAPGVGIGKGIGVSLDLGTSYYLVKTLGCKDNASYERGVLGIPFSLGGTGVTVGLGVEGPKLIDSLKWLVQGSWAAGLSPQKVDEEFDRVDAAFFSRLKDSESPLEVMALTVFLVFVNSVVASSHLAKRISQGESGATDAAKKVSLSLLKKIPAVVSRILEQVLSLDVIRVAKTPSFRNVLMRFRDKLVPESSYVFSRNLLDKLTDSMTGCDSISMEVATGAKAVSLGQIGNAVSYSYYVNPEFLGASVSPDEYERNKNKKLILDLASFGDFVDPDAWMKAGKTFGTNLGNSAVTGANAAVNTAKKAGETAVNAAENAGESIADDLGSMFLTEQPTCQAYRFIRVPAPELPWKYRKHLVCASEGLELAGLGESVASYSGMDNFGPLAFVARASNLSSTKYRFDHCIAPGGPAAARVGDALKQFFSGDLSP